MNLHFLYCYGILGFKNWDRSTSSPHPFEQRSSVRYSPVSKTKIIEIWMLCWEIHTHSLCGTENVNYPIDLFWICFVFDWSNLWFSVLDAACCHSVMGYLADKLVHRFNPFFELNSVHNPGSIITFALLYIHFCVL